MNIAKFKPGDIITRTKPTPINGKTHDLFTGKKVPAGGDHSYIGNKMIFRGTANGMIYLDRTTERDIKLFNGKEISLRFVEWQYGWEAFIDVRGEGGIFLTPLQLEKLKN